MAISLLPEGTVRRLGSSIVISSPVLLLKELLDNAIDSGATSIEVLVSSNTVDKIEVRDNGHGISPDDFDSLGRPGHTSKLRSFDELSGLGGRTLGFRGVALASANVVADVSLTTRVSTEQVATVLSLENEGGAATRGHASAPVGTTVRVTGLFSRFPVRSQFVVKEAPKSLARMRELLQAYALTRPWIRLRFTVFKTPNLSWSYAPALNGGVKEAATQLFGTELASQCVFKIFPSESRQAEPSTPFTGLDTTHRQEPGLIFEALVPIPGADTQKIAKGAFFSVDSRPVSSTRGTAKKLFSVFKKHLGEHFARSHTDNTPKDPFIWLDIRCPPGTYDVNVEPSKDNVLFREEQLILDQFKSFLSFVYSTPDCHEIPWPPSGDGAPADCEKPSGVQSEVTSQLLPSQVLSTSWRVDMSSGFDGLSDDGNGTDDTPQPRRQPRPDEDMSDTPESETASMGESSKEGLNPWSIAKLTSTHRRSEPLPEEPAQVIGRETGLSLLRHNIFTGPDGVPLSTRQERPANEPDFRLRHHDRVDEVGNPASKGKPLHDIFEREFRRAAVSDTQLSHHQNQHRNARGLQSPPTSSPRGYACDGPGLRQRARQRNPANSSRAVQSRISFDRGSRRQRHHNRDNIAHNRQSNEPSSMGRQRISAARRRQDAEEAENILSSPFDIDTRRERRLRQEPPSPQTPIQHTNPDIVEARTELSHGQGRNENTTQADLFAEDPRVKLITQQRSIAQNPQRKPKRLKTEQLPLETIPSGFQTHTLLLTMAADVCRIAQLFTVASQFDTYLIDGRLKGAFEGGASFEDNSLLVESFLARIGHGSTAAT